MTHHDAACTKKNKGNSRGFVLSFDYNFMFLSGTRCLRPKYSREQQGDLEEEHQKLEEVAWHHDQVIPSHSKVDKRWQKYTKTPTTEPLYNLKSSTVASRPPISFFGWHRCMAHPRCQTMGPCPRWPRFRGFIRRCWEAAEPTILGQKMHMASAEGQPHSAGQRAKSSCTQACGAAALEWADSCDVCSGLSYFRGNEWKIPVILTGCLLIVGCSSQIAASWGLVASVHTVIWPSKCQLRLLSIRNVALSATFGITMHYLYKRAQFHTTPTQPFGKDIWKEYKIRPPNKVLHSSCSMRWWPLLPNLMENGESISTLDSRKHCKNRMVLVNSWHHNSAEARKDPWTP